MLSQPPPHGVEGLPVKDFSRARPKVSSRTSRTSCRAGGKRSPAARVDAKSPDAVAR